MTVMESHDIALALQHKIEGLSDVERAFVHVDHQERDGLEHKVERELVRKMLSGDESDHSLNNSTKSNSSPRNVTSSLSPRGNVTTTTSSLITYPDVSSHNSLLAHNSTASHNEKNDNYGSISHV